MSTVLERFQEMVWEEAHPNEKDHIYKYIVPGGQNIFSPELIEAERQKRVERITKPKKGKVVKEEPVVQKGPPIEEVVKPSPVGQIFGDVLVVQEIDEKTWLCHCECGGIITVKADEVRSGNITSCGHCQEPESVVRLVGGRELEEIYDKALTGDEEALEQIIKHYETRLNNISEQVIARYRLSDSVKEDLIQIGRICIWNSIKSHWDWRVFKNWSPIHITTELERYLKRNNIISSPTHPAVSVGDLEDNQEELESSTYAVEYDSSIEWFNGLTVEEFIASLPSEDNPNLSPEKIKMFVDRTINEMTLAQVGKKYGKSPERIRQIERRIMRAIVKDPRYRQIGHSYRWWW